MNAKKSREEGPHDKSDHDIEDDAPSDIHPTKKHSKLRS
jgi:hypothetical protein